MREAIGGSWLLGFVILFIVLFSSYLAISINYSKAFKMKNQIVDIIEENEGFTGIGVQNPESLSIEELKNNVNFKDKTEAKILIELKESGYFTTASITCDAEKEGSAQTGGYCLKKINTIDGSYYKITTFIKFDLPLVNVSVKIPIKGETKTIFFDKG